MKKLILLTLVTSRILSSFGQKANQLTYSEKCSKQKKTGWVLFGTGAAVATTGFLIMEIDGTGSDAIMGENFDVGAWAFFAGLAGCVASIPFFISAHSQCKKSKKITLKIDHIQIQSFQAALPQKIPAISMRFSLP